MTPLEAALNYHKRGWVPIPLCWPNPDGTCGCGRRDKDGKPKPHEPKDVGKAPLIPNWQTACPDEKTIRFWFGKRWPKANVGLVLAPSRLLAVDTDSPDAYAEATERGLPETITRVSRNPAFLFARPDGCPVTNSTLQGESGKIDILANTQVVAYGTHRAGNPVYLEGDELAPAPRWAVDLLCKGNGHREGVSLPDDLPHVDVNALKVSDRMKVLILTGHSDRYPSRSEALFAVLEALIAAGYDDPTIASVIVNNPIGGKARDQGIKWLEGEIARARGKAQQGDFVSPSVKLGQRTINPAADDDTLQRDYGHAAVLAALFHNRYRWAVHRSTWMHYRLGVWRPVPEELVAKDAADALRQHYAAELTQATDKATVLDLTKKIAETCTYARITGALAFLKGWEGILTLVEEWDKDPWLLNVRNGTVDLRTCTLKPHDPNDLITKMADVDYNPNAFGEKWQRHIEMFLPNANVRRQVQRDLGVALVGATLEETLPIWYGIGANGKTTTARGIMGILGDYADRAAPNLLIQSKHERHPTEQADLCGKRLAFSVEVDQGKHLAEALVKDLTGGDRKKARFMYSDFFSFEQTFSIVLIVNHKPIVTGSDPGIWRRINLIPWEYRIDDNAKRPQDTVVAELVEDGSAILNWLLDGLTDWQRDRHWKAPEVQAANAAYRAEMDVLGDFITERCVLGPRCTVPKGELYAAYAEWCEQNHERGVSKKAFTQQLEARGIGDRKGTGGMRFYCGIGLKVADSGSCSVTSGEIRSCRDFTENVPLSATHTDFDTISCHVCGLPAFCTGDDGLLYCKDHAPEDQSWHAVPDT